MAASVNFAIALCFLATFAPCWAGQYKGDTMDHPMMKTVSKICKSKTQISEETFKKGIKEFDLDLKDPKLKEYIHCVFDTSGTLKDEKFFFNGFIAGMKSSAKKQYGPIMLVCKDKVDDVKDPAEKSLAIYKCFKKTAGDSLYLV